jgi:hypothetical protein
MVVHQAGIDILNPGSSTFRYYGAKHGVGSIDPDLNVVATDQFGNTWIGTNRGIVKYKCPGYNYRTKPTTLLNEVLVYMEPTMTEPEKNYKSNQNHLTFMYTGLWYTDPADIGYQYRLYNIDPEWITSRDQFAAYSNLAPGNYQFQVRTSLKDHFESAMIADYDFRISMPFWKTAWFYLALGLMVLVVSGKAIQIRERKARKKELIEREKYTFQFESLRSQINPHFLFNSFNTLISLIEEDPETAAKFTDKLSDYFRNILVMRDRELITLREELTLVVDYYYLLKSRYMDNFVLKNLIPDQLLDTLIPPMTLQMLVENALKHNIVSASRPLTFEIMEKSNAILARNNIQLKKQPEPSTGIGLENILKQYRLIAGKEVSIQKDENFFSVIIPVIEKKL